FFSSRRRHTRSTRDWSSDVCSSDLYFPDLTVVHIDAHGDLRDEYEGTPLSHASIERRVVDMGIPLTEIGIRSFSPEEAEFMKTRSEERRVGKECRASRWVSD